MLTYKNWYNFEWKFGKTAPLNCFDQWVFKPYISDLSDKNFKESVTDALLKIKDLGKPLVLFYSGGIDSEVILLECIKNEIDIIPVTIRFTDELNSQDVRYVNDFASRFNIDIHYLDIDFEEWFNDSKTEFGYRSLVSKYEFIHVATPLNLWARNQVTKLIGDCITITGAGDVPLANAYDKFDCFKWNWKICIAIDSQYKKLSWYKLNYPNDVPLFYMYTPQLARSFMNEPEIIDCVKEYSYKINVVSSKQRMFSRYWPELTTRKKYTGFEKVNINITKTDIFNDDFNNTLDMYTTIPYDDYIRLFRMPNNK